VLNKPRLHFRIYPETKIPAVKKRRFTKLIELKAKGLPLSYITKTHNFMGVNFKVNKNVLIARPETEELTYKVLEYIKSKLTHLKVLELCSGSGVISCIMALNTKNISITATDISPKALQTARLNAQKLKVSEKIKFIKSDLFKKVKGSFDFIVSNPPYCTANELAKIKKEVSFEPMLALYGGTDGMDLIRRIIRFAPEHLKKGGYLFMETGINHGRKISKLMPAKIWQNIKVLKDFNGFDRYLIAKLKNG
jgi:release factor glutamine methyltransferase